MSDTTPEVPTFPEYMSVSRLRTWGACNRQFAYQYLMNIPQRLPGIMVSGSGVDHALNMYWKARMEGRTPHPDEILNEFLVNMAWQQGNVEIIDPDPVGINDGVTLLRMYMRHPDIQRYEPAAFQEEVECPEISELLKYKFLGHLDLRIKEEGQDIIVDHKFVRKTPNEERLQKSFQMRFYSLAVHGWNATVPRKVRHIYLVRLKTRPDILIHDHVISDREIREFVEHARLAMAQMRKRVYPTVHPDTTFFCSEKGCGYWPICRGNPDMALSIPGEVTQ